MRLPISPPGHAGNYRIIFYQTCHYVRTLRNKLNLEQAASFIDHLQVNFFKKNLTIFKATALPLLILTTLSSLLEQYTSSRIQQILSSHDGIRPILYIFILLSVLISIFFPLITTSIAVLGVAQINGNMDAETSKNEKPSLKILTQTCLHIEQLTIETLRSWGSIMTWGLLFLVPAFFRYLQLLFVPFVVLLSKPYSVGKIDALQESKKILKDRYMVVFGILFIFHLFLPLITTVLFDQYADLTKTPVAAVLLNILETYLIILSIQILYNVFVNHPSQHKETPL